MVQGISGKGLSFPRSCTSSGGGYHLWCHHPRSELVTWLDMRRGKWIAGVPLSILVGAVGVPSGYYYGDNHHNLRHGAPITRCIIMYYCICIVSIYWELELHPQVLFMYPLVVCCTALEAMAHL